MYIPYQHVSQQFSVLVFRFTNVFPFLSNLASAAVLDPAGLHHGFQQYQGFGEEFAVPPSNELMDFNAFASAMMTDDIDNLHEYYDSEGEQDLEGDYDGTDLDSEAGGGETESNGNSESSASSVIDFNLDDDNDDNESSTEFFNLPNGVNEGHPYEYFDDDGEIKQAKAPKLPSDSDFVDPEVEAIMKKTEQVLAQLSLQAQPIIEEQPMSTQILLSNQALDQVFKPYGKHGSQLQFSAAVMKFLDGGDTIRRPGKAGSDKRMDGKLKFAPLDPMADAMARESVETKQKRLKLKRRGDGRRVASDGVEDLRIKVPKCNAKDVSTVVKTKKDQEKAKKPSYDLMVVDDNIKSVSVISGVNTDNLVDGIVYRKTSDPLDLAGNPIVTNVMEKVNLYTADRADLELRPANEAVPGHLDIALQAMQNDHTHLNSIPFTPLAATFSGINLRTPATTALAPYPSAPQALRVMQPVHFNPGNSLRPGTATSTYSCSVDPRANTRLASQPYNPIKLQFVWPATLRSDGQPCNPTPGLLDSINRILQLYNHEARFTLSYYTRKYGTPAHLSGPYRRRPEDEPPHALFRLGIAQWLMSQVDTIIEHKERDELGLNPEARKLLGAVWEAHPSMQAWFEDVSMDEVDYLQELVDANNYKSASDVEMTDSDGGEGLSSPRSPKKPDPRVKKLVVRGGLNPMEKMLLARACSIPVDAVEAYWDQMREKTKAWAATKAWCRARSAEKVARAKREGRW
ncbi:hypothetical protein LTR64_008022 [Lithohypha guttulata]|uniref:uncharacterized protein n=1 Tax=Lithohypha guttulata TaxID=1690604 RepID=UPI002DDE552C|nr:hypothetical protein LTR51_008109 [Lithohypha guttulata]